MSGIAANLALRDGIAATRTAWESPEKIRAQGSLFRLSRPSGNGSDDNLALIALTVDLVRLGRIEERFDEG